MNRQHLLITLALLALPVSDALPQAAEREAPQRELQQRFASSGLEVGSLFPAVDIYDSRGEGLNTSSLKGKYTVIVNGCLT